MKKNIFPTRFLPLIAAFCLMIMMIFAGCAKTFTGADIPVKLTIDSILPASGSAGQSVLIYGKGFSPRASGDKVFFNGLPATLDSNASYNVLHAFAPAQGTTGTVSVTANGDTATGPVFTYVPVVPVPIIANVVYNGVFFIEGSNFATQNSVVSIGGQVTTGFIYSFSNGQQTLSRPTYTPPAGLDNPAAVVVTVQGEASNAYPYLFYPQINGISPDTLYVNKTAVTVSGILFGTRTVPSTLRIYYYDPNQNKIYMSPDPAITSWNTNTIKFTVPDYSSYFVGISARNVYIEVNVSTKSTNKLTGLYR